MVTYSQPQWNNQAAEEWARVNLGQNMTAGGGNIINAAKAAGKFDQLQSDINAYNAQPPSAGAFVPATIEPLHQYTKAGLTAMGEPPAYGQGSMTMANQYLQNLMQNTPAVNPMATQYMGEAGNLVRGSAAPITMQDIDTLRNPYSQALQDRLTEQGNQARQAIMASQGLRGGRSFGDISQGRRESYLDAEVLRGRQDIDFKTYESALSNMQAQRNRELQAGGQMGQLGTSAQGITTSGINNALGISSGVFGAGQRLTDVGRQTAQDKIDAGEMIRRYNQAINDQIAGNILGASNYAPQQLKTVQDLLSIYQSGSNYQPQQTPSTLSQIGGLAQFGGGLYNYGQQAGYIRPSDNFQGPTRPIF